MTKKRETKKNGETMLTKLKALHDNLRTTDTRNTIPPVEYSNLKHNYVALSHQMTK
jgi:hypothetical protein